MMVLVVGVRYCRVSRGAFAFYGMGWRAQFGSGYRQMKAGFEGYCAPN